MEYLADTVAVVRHFSKSGKIGKDAHDILRQADVGKNTIWISIISIAEIMYLSEGNRIEDGGSSLLCSRSDFLCFVWDGCVFVDRSARLGGSLALPAGASPSWRWQIIRNK